jgi:uncharacterized protein YigE (DUF2233 family)
MFSFRQQFCTLLLLFLATPDVAAAGVCRSESFADDAFIVCSLDLTKDDVRLFWRDTGGKPFRTFSALAEDLEEKGKRLRFATNGGMYGSNYVPVGLYVEGGRELTPVNTATRSGSQSQIPNFYKKPNGVFFIEDGKAGVLETRQFRAADRRVDFATQSGPMLVIDGKIHPAFIVNSNDRKPRNGVCASSPTEVHFVMTERLVNFHDFARYFRDGLNCKNALFLDGGTASGLYEPELGRNDAPGHGGYGPIIAVVE